ncbi:hypothetical protein BHM03_00005595, partial [Ensete ventricosum]
LLISEEAERITQCKGRVFCLQDEPGVHRVWLPNEEAPGLAMSRAFGDYCIKDFGLISVPEVTQRSINGRDQFVVLATDGVTATAFYYVLIQKKSTYFSSIRTSFLQMQSI